MGEAKPDGRLHGARALTTISAVLEEAAEWAESEGSGKDSR